MPLICAATAGVSLTCKPLQELMSVITHELCIAQGEETEGFQQGEQQGVLIPASTTRSGAATPDVAGSAHSAGAAALGALVTPCCV